MVEQERQSGGPKRTLGLTASLLAVGAAGFGLGRISDESDLNSRLPAVSPEGPGAENGKILVAPKAEPPASSDTNGSREVVSPNTEAELHTPIDLAALECDSPELWAELDTYKKEGELLVRIAIKCGLLPEALLSPSVLAWSARGGLGEEVRLASPTERGELTIDEINNARSRWALLVKDRLTMEKVPEIQFDLDSNGVITDPPEVAGLQLPLGYDLAGHTSFISREGTAGIEMYYLDNVEGIPALWRVPHSWREAQFAHLMSAHVKELQAVEYSSEFTTFGK